MSDRGVEGAQKVALSDTNPSIRVHYIIHSLSGSISLRKPPTSCCMIGDYLGLAYLKPSECLSDRDLQLEYRAGEKRRHAGGPMSLVRLLSTTVGSAPDGKSRWRPCNFIVNNQSNPAIWNTGFWLINCGGKIVHGCTRAVIPACSPASAVQAIAMQADIVDPLSHPYGSNEDTLKSNLQNACSGTYW